jgi:hypothetical protein
MYHKDSLHGLAARARQGDAAAAARLRRDLVPRMRPVVRRALRPDTPNSVIVNWIRAVVDQLVRDTPEEAAQDPEWLLDVATRRVCELVSVRLLPGRAGGRAVQDTVRV